MNMPSVSKYNSGNLIEVTDVDPEFAEDAETHIKISSDFTGFLPYLNNHTNLSVYVTGTWTMTFDQRFINGNVLVVGNGGKVVIPSGFKLSNGGIDGTLAKNGTIIVMPGGEISGDGIVEATGDAKDFYNGGTVSAGNINLVGGMLYNAGNAGSESSTLTGEADVVGNPGQFVNFSNATFSNTNGSALGILNANNIKVVGNLTLSNASRMDDGSAIECGSLSLLGDGSYNSVLQMGNGSYLNCNGFTNISNYGLWDLQATTIVTTLFSKQMPVVDARPFRAMPIPLCSTMYSYNCHLTSWDSTTLSVGLMVVEKDLIPVVRLAISASKGILHLRIMPCSTHSKYQANMLLKISTTMISFFRSVLHTTMATEHSPVSSV